MIEAKAICDSIGPTSDYTRLHTQLWRYPKFVHQESLRHRRLIFTDWKEQDFSFSVSSARAIPFTKLLEEVRSDELRAEPAFWGSEQKGMSPGIELTDNVGDFPHTKQHAKDKWREAALEAAKRAEDLEWTGVHKSIVNRIIEPYIHVNCLVTGTSPGWLNFFGLRLDKAADPTLRALAEASWKAWNESIPRTLTINSWHTPLADDEETTQECWFSLKEIEDRTVPNLMERVIKTSVARCARLSYMSFSTQKRSTIEEDLDLYQRLVGSLPIHASPAEHQATPDQIGKLVDVSIQDHVAGKDWVWLNPKEAGNLGSGWRQYRKMLPNEAIAPLPSEYQT